MHLSGFEKLADCKPLHVLCAGGGLDKVLYFRNVEDIVAGAGGVPEPHEVRHPGMGMPDQKSGNSLEALA